MAARKSNSSRSRAAAGKRAAAVRKAPRRTARAARKGFDRWWHLYAATLILGLALLRLAVNAADLVPVHFDEAQYWAYGHERTAGHFSKPPLVGWLILVATEVGGDTTFALRLWSVACHAIIGAMIFLSGTALFDGRTGFWAVAAYSVAPGVSVSAMIMSTDPPMMACWSIALYAWIRAATGGGARWWLAMGAAAGAGMLAKYTALAFLGGAAAYGLLSLRHWDMRGAALVGVAALAVFSPNLIWQIQNSFHTVAHVAEDAAPGGSLYNPDKLAEFTGSQLGVIGPVWFIAIAAALLFRRHWVGDWRMRLLAWQTYPLLVVIIAVSFTTRAHPNWAAPAYIAGSILAANWLISRGWHRALGWQALTGAVGASLVYGAAVIYAIWPLELPRGPDPFKKMRVSEPFCAPALAAMSEEGAEVLLSTDRRRLSECMFLGGLTFDQIAVWNPDLAPKNHHELVATLYPGDHRRMLLAVLSPDEADRIATHFDEKRQIDVATVPTHADRSFSYSLWVLKGFGDY